VNRIGAFLPAGQFDGRKCMKTQWKWMFAGVCALLLAGLCPAPVRAQQKMEVKEKPPMFSYVANWGVSRDKWKDIESEVAKDNARMAKFLSSGDVVGYGSDINLVHQEGESTHDDWWSSMSWAGLLKVLQDNKAAGTADAPVFAASKHHDDIFVSRYYNWRSGSFTNGFTRIAQWKLKADAPDDAIEKMAKNFLVPMYEQLLADGSIYEYEIDEQAIHTAAPGEFWVIVIANGPEGLDKARLAQRDAGQANPFAFSAFGSWVDESAHRDYLDMTSATYK
jgi:hypothetical protein